MIESASQRVNVAAHVGAPRIAGLLGRDIVECPQCRAGDRQVGGLFVFIFLAGQPQIYEFGSAKGRDNNVRRLDIAMDNPLGGSMHQRRGDLQNEIERVADRQPRLLSDQLAHVRSVDELECDVVQPVFFADEVHTGHILMVELRGGLTFVFEPLDDQRVARQCRGQNLERHDPVQPRIQGPKHGPHAPRANSFDNREVAQLDSRLGVEGLDRRLVLGGKQHPHDTRFGRRTDCWR